ncbi:MAG: hypothetical protein KIS67_25055 [Verrucomicrobiae bacterium]|nr:hypothetical protein [Verrucomicrobiae bacterium]
MHTRNIARLVFTPLALACLLPATGCRSAYCAAYEKVGVHKRDLLKKRVTDASETPCPVPALKFCPVVMFVIRPA